MIKLFFAFTFFLFALSSSCQQFSFSKEIKFAKHLQEKEAHIESAFVLNNIDTTGLLQSQKDSLLYELGWFYYSQKKLDTAIYHFTKISSNDSRKLKANFFVAYCQTFLKKYTASDSTLKSIKTNDTVFNEFKNFQFAGLALLKKDYQNFNDYASNFSFSNYAFGNEEKNLNEYKQKMISHRKKSPFIAATLSAIIPGAGKWYAGKKKEALGAFLPILSSGLLALEGYNKGGLKDARFIIFATLFTTFYIGNIWGSSFAVKISQTEFENKYENKILFDMHIPLRNLFN